MRDLHSCPTSKAMALVLLLPVVLLSWSLLPIDCVQLCCCVAQQIKAKLPVTHSFGFAEQLRKRTRSVCACVWLCLRVVVGFGGVFTYLS